MSFAPGALVRARGREWVVLPESEDDLLVLRPLGGTDDEVAGIVTDLEEVTPASFDLPDPEQIGDYRSARLLRDALRLGFRSSAGPFRSFGHIAVEPRPYQLVPLLMAMRLETVRLIIADDVGIGKTVEAGLIARELLDQGSAQRLAVLCPPHLAEQWQAELFNKFHLEAELVLSGTATRLERGLRIDETLFDRYPYVIVSTDFIKSQRRRQEFLRACPDLVIVDEAHTCADPSIGRARHLRYELLRGLSADSARHLILVTATPHSGNEDAFRALVGLLDESFRDLPEDLGGEKNRGARERLARHLVQRRRADIRAYMDEDTPFPERHGTEMTYGLSPDGKLLFADVLAYARESVRSPGEARHRQRVRWWSALALLQALASSPAAAADTLRSRANVADTETAEEADELGRRTLLDQIDDESTEGTDITPGAIGDAEQSETIRRLHELADRANALCGAGDPKLKRLVEIVKELQKDGFRPIVFCRFVATAEYVAAQLRTRLRGTEVDAVTGRLPPAEREARIEKLTEASQDSGRVLIATDCLSEGVNLQEHFDAVVHYDLSWNPTRHEQREGRVDRFGQPKPVVRVVTYYGKDNQIDGLVLRVLLRKHQKIRDSLGISVPVPADANTVLEAVLEGLLLSDVSDDRMIEQLELFESQTLREKDAALDADWQNLAERERRNRTVFAQNTIGVTEVAQELEQVRKAIGSAASVQRFVIDALTSHQATLSPVGDAFRVNLTDTPPALRDAMGGPPDHLRIRFRLPAVEGDRLLSRTDPLVEGLAAYVLDSALDAIGDGAGRRAGAMRTAAVGMRTTLLLTRFRFHLTIRSRGEGRQLLVEDCAVLAFRGSPASAEWLDISEAEALLESEPAEPNLAPAQQVEAVRRMIDGYEDLRAVLESEAAHRAETIGEAHRRVREGAGASGQVEVKAQLPVDLLGLYVLVPGDS